MSSEQQYLMWRVPPLVCMAVGLCLALLVVRPVTGDEAMASRKTKKTSFDRVGGHSPLDPC